MFTIAEGVCWTRTAERQTSKMRKEYLKSVLRQEVGFFDTQAAGSSTTSQVVSIITSDANAVQVALCEKVFAFINTLYYSNPVKRITKSICMSKTPERFCYEIEQYFYLLNKTRKV